MARIFIGNIPYDIDEVTLAATIATFGVQVRNVKILTDKDTGRPRGFGFAEVNDDDVQGAIAALNGQYVGNRPLSVDVAKERTGGAPRPRYEENEGRRGRR